MIRINATTWTGKVKGRIVDIETMAWPPVFWNGEQVRKFHAVAKDVDSGMEIGTADSDNPVGAMRLLESNLQDIILYTKRPASKKIIMCDFNKRVKKYEQKRLSKL